MIGSSILKRLASLRLPTEAFQEVLAIIADVQAADEARKENGRRRTSRWRHGDGDVTEQERHEPRHSPPRAYTSPPSSEPKKVPRTCANALPTTWQLDEQDRAFAESKGWNDQRIASEGERFRDHALAGGRKQRDWHAAWRNWVTSPYQAPQKVNGNGKTQGSLAAAADDLIREARELERGTCSRDDLFRGDGDGQVIDGTVGKSEAG